MDRSCLDDRPGRETSTPGSTWMPAVADAASATTRAANQPAVSERACYLGSCDVTMRRLVPSLNPGGPVLRTSIVASLLVAALFGTMPASAQTPAPAAPAAPPEKIDYSKPETWLCRPGRTDDACAVDLTTTVVAANGTMTQETWAANPKAPIDCFYVYPTVSMDPATNSDMTAGNEERNVVRQQFARFASQCRPFAPLYRQVTLTGLRAVLASPKPTLDQGIQYDDVLNAWNYYLKNDNGGRPVVLIAHSQGSFILIRLIAEQIDGKPVQSQLVSAILMGTTIAVPKGKEVGGAFKSIPLCRKPGQTGCLISFATFRSTMPPPANTLFGKVDGEGMEAVCVNPAALAGGSGPLHAYLTGAGSLIVGGALQKQQWVTSGAAIETPFVSVPGLLTAQCARNENGHYLELTVHGDPADPRADDIPGDLAMLGRVQPNWGMHLVDVNLTMGNLVDIVAAQAKAFKR
nr:esterase [uncultured bacterium]